MWGGGRRKWSSVVDQATCSQFLRCCCVSASLVGYLMCYYMGVVFVSLVVARPCLVAIVFISLVVARPCLVAIVFFVCSSSSSLVFLRRQFFFIFISLLSLHHHFSSVSSSFHQSPRSLHHLSTPRPTMPVTLRDGCS